MNATLGVNAYGWRTIVATTLPGVADEDLVGLLRAHAAAIVTEPGASAWELDGDRWGAIRGAIIAAASGQRPPDPGGRVPTWVEPLVHSRIKELSRTWSHSGDEWCIVRILERHGLVTVPHDDAYTLAFVGTRGGGHPVATIRTDPGALDVLWRCFEVEGGGEISLANVDKYANGAWSAAVRTLVRDGDVDRDRVLTATLGALARDFSAYRAGWFSRLWTALDPTLDELAVRQPALRGLLRSDVRPTVTLAVNALRRLGDAGLLDGPAAVAALAPAVLSPAKGTALAAVALIGRTVDAGVPTESAASVLDVALEHPHADVQRAAAAVLVRLGRIDVVAVQRDGLAPSVVAAVLADIPDERVAVDCPRTGFGDAAAPEPALPVDLVPTAFEVASRVDVTERLAALLEDPSDPFELEAVLACLAAEGDASLVAPLRRRADTLVRRALDDGAGERLRTRVAMFVRCSADRAVRPVSIDRSDRPKVSPSVRFLSGRLDDVVKVLRTTVPAQPLVATPTTRSGWVDGDALVERLTGPTPPLRRDLVAALLRLAPEGRAPALGRLETIRVTRATEDARSSVAAVAYALGGEPPDVAPDPGEAALWVAAARARAPLSEDEVLRGWGLTGAGRSEPLAPDPADALAEWRHDRERGRGEPQPTYQDEPTADRGEVYLAMHQIEGWVPWIATIWPADAEYLARVAGDLVWSATDWTTLVTAALDTITALGDHEGRIGDLAATTFAAGLAARKVDLRVHAVDAVARQVRAGRLDVARTARAVTAFAPHATLTRWSTSWADLAATGPDLGAFVVDLLVAVLPALPAETRGRHALIELLDEELLRRRAATPADLVPWLETLKGSSRAARTAARLAARTT